MHWTYNDGGRKAAGYKGFAGDCVTRAIAIATGYDYSTVYTLINDTSARHERLGARKAHKSRAADGVYKTTIHRVLQHLGWTWTPTMRIGAGCTVHLRAEELPTGRLIVQVSKHTCAVIDGVLHDTHDCTRGGTRCVYGFWSLKTPNLEAKTQ